MADFGPELLRLIKQTVGNYIQNQNLSDAVFATYTGKGLKVDDKPIKIEMDMVNVPEHLKKYKARISFDLTQEELAQLVGSSRETVNKALMDFANRRWIAREGRSIIIYQPGMLIRRSQR